MMAAAPDVYALKQFPARNGHEQVHVNEHEKKSEKPCRHSRVAVP